MKGKCSVLVAALLAASTQASVHAQISTKEQQAEQDTIDAKTPKLKYNEEVLQLLVPGYTMGETVGVDVNAENHIFVYSRSEEHTSELQSPDHLVCRLLLEKKKNKQELY